jgi:hypothetical protein
MKCLLLFIVVVFAEQWGAIRFVEQLEAIRIETELKDELKETTLKGRANQLARFEKIIKDGCLDAAANGRTSKNFDLRQMPEIDLDRVIDAWKKKNEPDVKLKRNRESYIFTVCWMNDTTCD